jgi:hypothetical protein
MVAFLGEVVLPASLERDVDDSTDVELPEAPVDPALPEFSAATDFGVAVVLPVGASPLAVALDDVPPLLAEVPAELPPEDTPADAPPVVELPPPADEEPPSAELARAAAGARRDKHRSAPSKASRPANRCVLPRDAQRPCVMSPCLSASCLYAMCGVLKLVQDLLQRKETALARRPRVISKLRAMPRDPGLSLQHIFPRGLST